MKESDIKDIDFLNDVFIRINAKVGSIQKLVVELLDLKEGDIIALDKHIEEYITLTLNDKEFALGEIVVANKKYGVRIVDLIR